MDYRNSHFSASMKASLDPSNCEMDLVAFRTCKFGKRLQRFEQRELCENYDRRFLRCPDYVGLDRCYFEWVDEAYPEAARDCINKLIVELKKAEAENVFLKEDFLLGMRKKDHELSPTTARQCIRKLNGRLQWWSLN